MVKSPGEAQLDLFSPEPEGLISAQIFKEVRAAPLPCACDLHLAGTRWCKCCIPSEHCRCRWLRVRYQNHLPEGPPAPDQLGPSSLPSTGSAGGRCRWEAEL